MLDKILASFAYPLGLSLTGLVIAGVAVTLGARRSGAAAIFGLTLLLWAGSTPLVSQWAVGTLETPYPVRSAQSYKPVDVIILLGGVLSPPGPEEIYPDLGEAADRALHAFQIYQAGLAPKILISGGNLFPDGRMAEGEALAGLLTGWGIDRDAIIVEGRSRTTYENAQETARIWLREGFRSALLVTSAMHMDRALATFRKAGTVVEPASTDFRSARTLPPFPLSILPDAGCLEQTSLAIKEWLGLAVYHWRGWA